MSKSFDPMQNPGWQVWPGLLSPKEVEALKTALRSAYKDTRALQLALLPDFPEGVVHHVLPKSDVFYQFLNGAYLHQEISAYFKGPYILNSFSGVILPPSQKSYLTRIHRDLRHPCPPHRLMLNMIVVLDEFRADNGATWLMPQSQEFQNPEPEAFFEKAQQLTAPPGSLILFHSELWHCAGQNLSAQERCALTLTWTKPWIKPQFDYLSQVRPESEHMKQILGVYSQVPQNDHEWYQVPEKRFYRSDQI